MDEVAVEMLRSNFDVLYDPTLVEARADLLTAVSNSRALIVRNATQVDQALISAAPRLEVVGRLGVGLDNIDLDTCHEREIEVCPATGANADSVAEYVLTSAMLLLRPVYEVTSQTAAGEWPRQQLAGHELSGKQLGLVGLGVIARAIAKRAHALGMNVAAHDPYLKTDDPAWKNVKRIESLLTLLSSSDVVSIHVPLTESTRGLIDQTAIEAMSSNTILVQTARGGVIDEDALVEALRSGNLGGAALDVFAEEPLTAETGVRFIGVPNLRLTPHIAGITIESNSRVSLVTAENVCRVLSQSTS